MIIIMSVEKLRGSMNKQQTIKINGVSYDTYTGMRIDDIHATPKVANNATHHARPAAHAIHGAKTQKSTTLSRRHVQSPASTQKSLVRKPSPVVHTKSPMIEKFAKHHTESPKPMRTMNDFGPIAHPKVVQHSAKSEHHAAHHQSVAHAPTNHDIKNHAIAQAMKHEKVVHKHEKKQGKSRLPGIVSASLALMLFAGYLTYINMPGLSVRVAAAQAGIAASFPSYQPAGYSIKGPVASTDGQVSMQFASNSNPQNFTLNQSRSTWDSGALLENYVEQASNGKYDTFSDSGLTVYVYGNQAAWVNGGILHTINGDAELSSEQIRNIATSM